MKHPLRSMLLAVLLVLIAVPAFAAETKKSPRAHRYKAMSSTPVEVRVFPAEVLRNAGLPENDIQHLAARDIFDIPTIPTEDVPEFWLDVYGTGNMELSGHLPKPSYPIPVLVFTQRTLGCVGGGCPFNLTTLVWAQSTFGVAPPRVSGWFTVDEVPGTLQGAHAGRFKSPGTYNVLLAALHLELEVFMTRTLEVEVHDFEFYFFPCSNENGNVEVTLQIDALAPIPNGSLITVNLPGVSVKTAIARVAKDDGRYASTTIVLSEEEYEILVNQEFVEMTVTVGGKTRSREEFFPPLHELYSCDEGYNGKGLVTD